MRNGFETRIHTHDSFHQAVIIANKIVAQEASNILDQARRNKVIVPKYIEIFLSGSQHKRIDKA